MREDTSSVEGTDIEQNCSNEETIENNECAYHDAECTSRQEQIATESLRQRTNKQSPVVRLQLAVTFHNALSINMLWICLCEKYKLNIYVV